MAQSIGQIPLDGFEYQTISLASPMGKALKGLSAGQIAEAFTYDLCDTADPRKRYAPGDAAGSDMTSLDTERGVSVESTSTVTAFQTPSSSLPGNAKSAISRSPSSISKFK